jgi:hypothetical protein
MKITVITVATPRDQQQAGACPWLVDVPPDPSRH